MFISGGLGNGMRQTPHSLLVSRVSPDCSIMPKQLPVPTRFDRSLCYFMWAGLGFRVIDQMVLRHPAMFGSSPRPPDERDQIGKTVSRLEQKEKVSTLLV